MWQEAVQPYVEEGKLVVIAAAQEQHPERALLYRQWRKLDWPIFVDSLNLLDIDVVPLFVALDESGVVRHTRLRPNRLKQGFLDVEYPATRVSTTFNRADQPDIDTLRKRADQAQNAAPWRDLGDGWFLLSELSSASDDGPGHGEDRPQHRPKGASLENAIAAYQKAVDLDPKDGRAHFRLGVTLRARSESRRRKPGDAQEAVEHWGAALAINANQYIWRRRIQQYGPRLDKPYDFYSWVEQARGDIKARGEEPVPLPVEPSGSEVVVPTRHASRRRPSARTEDRGSADGIVDRSVLPEEKHDAIRRDIQSLIRIEPVVTPARVRPGHRVRARVNFRVNEQTRPYWNNEAEGLSVRLDLGKVDQRVKLVEGELVHPNPPVVETQEDRAIEFELSVGPDAPDGEISVPAYTLYYVCENKGGKCRYLRQDFAVTVHVDANAPTIR